MTPNDPNQVGRIDLQIDEARKLAEHLAASNRDNPHYSQRFEVTSVALAQIADALATLAAAQRENRAAIQSVEHRGLTVAVEAANHKGQYRAQLAAIGAAFNKSADASNGLDAATHLRSALRHLLGLLERVLLDQSVMSARLSQHADLLRRAMPLIERESDTQRRIDGWLSDALRGDDV